MGRVSQAKLSRDGFSPFPRGAGGIYSFSVTVPAEPSTVIICPVRMRLVAEPTPRTAGMPYSRATIELWLSSPPISVTIAAARANRGVQAGVVVTATRMSPGLHLVELFWPLQDAGPARDLARAGSRALEGAALLIFIRHQAGKKAVLGQRPGRRDGAHGLPAGFAFLTATSRSGIAARRDPFFKGFRQPIHFGRLQPVHIGGARDRPAICQPPAQFSQHLADLGITQPQVGDAVFAQRHRVLGPFQQSQEPLAAQPVEPADDRIGGPGAVLQGRLLALVGVAAPLPAARVQFDRLHQQRWVVARQRPGKVQAVDGMPVFLQVVPEAQPELVPRGAVIGALGGGDQAFRYFSGGQVGQVRHQPGPIS